MKSAKLFTLNAHDFFKGLIIAVIGSVIGFIQSSIEAGSLHFDWTAIGKAALLSVLAYLTKNFLTNNNGEFMTKDIPK